MLANYYKIIIPDEHFDQAADQMCKVQNYFRDNVDGCLKYQFSQSLEDKSLIYLFVVWESQELYEKNLDTDYQTKEVFDKFIEYNAAIVSAEQFVISKHLDVA